jgi:hypothetical protein
MACKYIFNGVEYKDKQTFIEEFVKPNFINQPRTLRVQEYQSDYFQKLRNNFKFRGVPHNIIIPADNNGKKVYLIDEVEVSSNVYNKAFEDFIDAGGDNQFLALLHKNDNWITFGIKAIIQNAAKQTITEVQQEDVEAKVRELEKEGLLEIDCKGKLKAEKGLTTSFTKGGKWKVIKDLKDYPTHKEGGVDLTIGKDGVSIKNGNTQFTAKHGLVIPKN